jgi:hypothetical protein
VTKWRPTNNNSINNSRIIHHLYEKRPSDKKNRKVNIHLILEIVLDDPIDPRALHRG